MITVRQNYKDRRISPFIFSAGKRQQVERPTLEQQARQSFFFWMYSRFAGEESPEGQLVEDMAFDARCHNLPAFTMTPEEWLDRVAGAVGSGSERTLRLMRHHEQCYRQHKYLGRHGKEKTYPLEKVISAIQPENFFHRQERQQVGF